MIQGSHRRSLRVTLLHLEQTMLEMKELLQKNEIGIKRSAYCVNSQSLLLTSRLSSGSFLLLLSPRLTAAQAFSWLQELPTI